MSTTVRAIRVPSSSSSTINGLRWRKHTHGDGFNPYSMLDVCVFGIIGFFMFQHGLSTQSVDECRLARSTCTYDHEGECQTLLDLVSATGALWFIHVSHCQVTRLGKGKSDEGICRWRSYRVRRRHGVRNGCLGFF